MAQETHQGGHAENKTKTPFSSAFWFVIILVFLFIAAINFVNVMSNDNGEGNKITDVPKPIEAPREATASQTLAKESGEGKPVVDSASKSTTYSDTTQKH